MKFQVLTTARTRLWPARRYAI